VPWELARAVAHYTSTDGKHVHCKTVLNLSHPAAASFMLSQKQGRLMQVHIFKGVGRVFGCTKDGLGANLPLRYGPWTSFKVVEMTRREAMPGVNSDECLADIEEYGLHLTDAHVRITDRAHA
jgi:hypothetical protein